MDESRQGAGSFSALHDAVVRPLQEAAMREVDHAISGRICGAKPFGKAPSTKRGFLQAQASVTAVSALAPACGALCELRGGRSPRGCAVRRARVRRCLA